MVNVTVSTIQHVVGERRPCPFYAVSILLGRNSIYPDRRRRSRFDSGVLGARICRWFIISVKKIKKTETNVSMPAGKRPIR